MTVGEVPRLPGGLADELRRQADRCRPSCPLYTVLLRHAAEDAAAGGVVADLLGPYADEPLATVPALRLLAAVHRLVLEERLPALAPYYPSVGGTAPPEEAWPAFRAALVSHRDEITALVAEPVQTNEPGRAAVLFGGLVTVAARTGLPVRLLEIGASAGLNLRADRFAYRVGGVLLGDPDSPVRFDEPWVGLPRAGPATAVRVVARRGCDRAPVDPTTRDGRLRLLSLVWASDVARVQRLRAALEVAARVPATVDAADVDAWLADQLAEPTPGAATVVWHSVVRQYVDPDRWRRVGETLRRAGDRAGVDAPLAHVALEPDVDADGTYTFHAHLTVWPGGGAQTVATAGAHGPPVRWTMAP